jgi:hypothetical protein
VVDFLAIQRKARGAVGHHALTLRRADRGAKIGLARQAGGARPAFRRVERNDVIAFLDRGYAGANIDDDAGTFVAEDRRKEPLGVRARKGEFIGVADSRGLDLDEHLTGARPVEFHVGHFQRFAGREGHGGANIHVDPQGRKMGGEKGAKVCMRRLQKQGRAMTLVTMYARDT